MSNTVELSNTGIPANIIYNLREKYSMGWSDGNTSFMYRIIFTTIASYLKTVQTKSNPKTGLVIKDSKGIFKLGAIMTYHKPDEDEEDDKGNWTIEITLNEKDLEGCDPIYDNQSDSFYMVAMNEVHTTISGRIESAEYCSILFCEFIQTLVDYLDANANPEDVFEIEIPGVFIASVAIEKGKKVIGITPGEIIRQMIKSDDIL